MGADNIVVLKKGQVVQQGTHDQLMADTDGHYFGLAHAQQLSMADDSMTTTGISDPEKQNEDEMVPLKLREEFETVTCSENPVIEPKSFRGSFGLFLWEQKYQWRWYGLMILGAGGAGGMSVEVELAPIVAYANWTQSHFRSMHFSSRNSFPCLISGESIYETRLVSGA